MALTAKRFTLPPCQATARVRVVQLLGACGPPRPRRDPESTPPPNDFIAKKNEELKLPGHTILG